MWQSGEGAIQTGDYTGQAPDFHCVASHSRSVLSLIRASCSRSNSASVLVRTRGCRGGLAAWSGG
jgi:hypothetical protein